jgi:hypothetical protein
MMRQWQLGCNQTNLNGCGCIVSCDLGGGSCLARCCLVTAPFTDNLS